MILGLLLAPAAAAPARPAIAIDEPAGGVSGTGGYLQCVPYARSTSGIRLYGDAHTWWGQAKGKYARGHVPRPGAVMAIEPHGNSVLGHVATVRRVVDTRTITIDHANWSNRGQIERNVTAIDVSPKNDWSEVRVWFAPIRNLGTTHWPVSGFIYNAKPGAKAGGAIEMAAPAQQPALLGKPALLDKAGRRAIKADRKKDPIGAIIAGRY